MKFIRTFIGQLRRWNEIENRKCDKIQTKIENATKCRQKVVNISFMRGCKYVCVYKCGCKCVRVDACFKVKSGPERKALVKAVMGYGYVCICCDIFFR